MMKDPFLECAALDGQAFPERPLAALGLLYRGEGKKLLAALGFYLVKTSPVWVFPIITAAIIDAEAAVGLFGMGSNLGIDFLARVVFPIVYTLAKDPRIALVFVVAIPLPLVMVAHFRTRIFANAHAYRSDIETMNASVSESLALLPLVKAHATEGAELRRLNRAIERVARSGKRLDVFNGLFGSSVWVGFQAASLACLGLTAWFRLQGTITTGDMVLYNGFFVSILSALGSLVSALPELARGMESLRSIAEVLNAPEHEDESGKLSMPQLSGSVAFREVCFSYPGATVNAVSDLDFQASPGQQLAFVGESGSGKSTVMSLLIGLLKPGNGKVLVDGQDLATLRLGDYRRFISVVSQDVVLFSGTVRDNVGFGLESAEEHAIVEALRAANALDRLMDGRSTFTVAHRLSTIRRADQILVMEGSRIVERGSWDDLVRQEGVFARMSQVYQLAGR